MSRYTGRRQAVNSNEMYDKLLEDRGVEQILQYTTPTLKLVSADDLERITTIDYTWRQGDKFWRLAAQHYGNPSLWWVIAQFNQKPTEHHISIGDTIKIPTELAVALGAMS